MANIALLPGGFKPPHAGHYAVAKYLSQKSGAEVLVRVGAKERDSITQNMSINIWDMYGIKAEPASSDSPIADVFKYVEEKATEEDIIYVGTGEKDFPRFKVLTDPSFKPDNYKKYNPKDIKVIEIPIPPQAGGVSGTKMREFINNDQKDLFQKYLPDHIDKDKVWNIVIDNIQEDLYNPEDKVNDYMRGSEWKAGMPGGPKDDVPPGYKYRRGGQYNAASGIGGAGTMYEVDGKGKILHAYDFDDTIAQVQANIKVFITSPSGDYNKEILIPASNFPEESKELEARLGSLEIKYDFAEFEKQIDNAIINSKVINKLKDSLSRPEVKTTILTARSIGHPVTRYLKSIGLDAYVVPLGLQVGGKVTGQDKANWIENHIKKGYKTVYFIDDSQENRTAVAALKDKYPDISLTVEDPAVVTEKMSTADVDAVEDFADKKLDPVDVDLTSNHFFDRLNDPRNKKEISGAELIGFFKRLSKRKKEFIEFLKQYKELVVTDDRTNINIPFMRLANRAIAKTVMRKSDFQTSSPSLTLEKTTEDSVICDNCGWEWKIKDGGNDLYICHKCDHDNTPLQIEVKYGVHDMLSQVKNKIKDPQEYRDFQLMLSQNKDEEVEKELKRKGYMNETPIFSQNWWKEQLTEVITETKANTHLTHLEELVLTQGQDGYNQAKSFLYELIKNLKGEDNSIKNVSVKWDGAPAIFTGINPDNGKFFVGTKSVFNVNPKIKYTAQDIDTNHGHAAGLAKKLKLALQYLPVVGIKGILQGDFMFDSDDVETDDIDGVSHYTFKPNTIRYAVETNSKIGKRILNAKIGIIFHTTYKDLSGSGASFGADISDLSESSNVWFDNAYFKDDTGILLNDKEEKFVLEKIKEADSLNVNYDNLPDEISSRSKVNLLNTYLNSEVRRGEFINDPNKSFETFVNWYKEKIEKAVAKISPKNQEKKRAALIDKLKTFVSAKDIVLNLFKVSKLLSEAKAIFITKYDKAVATKHFIDNEDGTLSVTKAEGFVAVDHTESGIKLVDRLEFSKNNFNAGKPGAKK